MKRFKNKIEVSGLNKFKVVLLPLVIFFLIPLSISNKRIEQNTNTVTARADIDKIVEQEIIHGNLVGLAVSVVKDGKVIHQKSYGFTDLEKKTPFTNSTVFRWASISKVITAVATHQLIEDNKLNLSDQVSDKVSYWREKINSNQELNLPGELPKNTITVKQLLSHRSGIRHYEEYKTSRYTSSASGNWNPKQSVNVFKEGSLKFDPGTDHNYTTFGYNLLGAVVHEVGGGFDSHVNSRIKNKLGLTSLTHNSAKGIKGYNKLCDDILVNTDGSKIIYKVPGGGYLSDIKDLNKFMMGLMNGELLDDTSRLWKENISTNSGYSLGVRRVVKGSQLFVEHGGAHSDMRTKMIFNTTKKDGIVIAVNGGNYAGFTMQRIVDRIANVSGIYGSNRAIYPYHYSHNNKENSCNHNNFAVLHYSADNDVVLRRGYSHKTFLDEWERLGDAGYVCVNFETYLLNNKRVWDGIFKKQPGNQAMWRNFDLDGFHDKWEEMSKKGYRLIDLETYKNGSKRLYAGLFLPGKGKYAMFRGYSTDDFGAKRKELAEKGYKLIDIEVYHEKNQLKWCGVWIEGKDGMLNRNYNTKEFKELVETRKKNGWNLIDVETYMVGKERKWAGIWEKSNNQQIVDYDYYHNKKFSDSLNSYISKKNIVLTSFGRY